MDSMAFMQWMPPCPVYSMVSHFSNSMSGTCSRKCDASQHNKRERHSFPETVQLQFSANRVRSFFGDTEAIHKVVVGNFGEGSEPAIVKNKSAIAEPRKFRNQRGSGRTALFEERSANLRQNQRTELLESLPGSGENAEFGALRVDFGHVNRRGLSATLPIIERNCIYADVFSFAEIANRSEGSPAGFRGRKRALKFERTSCLPDGRVLRSSPGKRGKISRKTLKDGRIGFKGMNGTCGADQPGSEVRVIPDMRADVEKSLTRGENGGQTTRDMRFIAAHPHLTLNSVVEIHVQGSAGPQFCCVFVSLQPDGECCGSVHGAQFSRKRRQYTQPPVPSSWQLRRAISHRPHAFRTTRESRGRGVPRTPRTRASRRLAYQSRPR